MSKGFILSAQDSLFGQRDVIGFGDDSFCVREIDRDRAWERAFSECPKCGARGRCDKHGLTASGIDLRARGPIHKGGKVVVRL